MVSTLGTRLVTRLVTRLASWLNAQALVLPAPRQGLQMPWNALSLLTVHEAKVIQSTP
jgi:hypothetical protein